MNEKTRTWMVRAGVAAAMTIVQVSGSAQDAPLAAPAVAEPARTRAPFRRWAFKPGFERRRVVRRENTANNVAAQVALNVDRSLLAGGVSFGGRGFLKDDLAGVTLEELQDDPVAVNPAMAELLDALSVVATDIYRKRAAAALAEAKQDGSTPQEVEEAGRVQGEADTPLHPGVRQPSAATSRHRSPGRSGRPTSGSCSVRSASRRWRAVRTCWGQPPRSSGSRAPAQAGRKPSTDR
ncbi:MAG TPA: hypothetical protein VIP10_11215 [Burkholderiaceae bacterium]